MAPQSDFDAYHKWLGIPPQHQPPNHYRLLGLEEYESDPDVIQAAAERQMAHVQSYKIGPQSDLSQELLNVIAKAKVCLLNPARKAEYDMGLRAADMSLRASAGQSRTSADAQPLIVAKEVPTSVSPRLSPVVSVSPRKAYRRKRRLSWWPALAICLVGIVASAAAIMFLSDRRAPIATAPEDGPAMARPTRPESGPPKVPDASPGPSHEKIAAQSDNSKLPTDQSANPITEQSHGNSVAETDGLATTDEAAFVSLFNGKDLSGWTGSTQLYSVEDGLLVQGGVGRGKLYTVEEYSDFVLRFEYRLTAGADNGIGFRTPATADPAVVVLEVQLLDESADRFREVPAWKRNGSCGVAAAKQGFQKPPGEWNHEEIIAQGQNMTVILNGSKILDANFEAEGANVALDFNSHPALARRRGHVALLADTPRVEFRNIRLKSLDTVPLADRPSTAPPQQGFSEFTLPSGRKINEKLLAIPTAEIKKLFVRNAGRAPVPFSLSESVTFVLKDSAQNVPVGLFRFNTNGSFDGPALIVGDNGQPSVLTSYSAGQRHGVLRSWDGDGELLLWAEYLAGRKSGIVCLCQQGRPVRIEEWDANNLRQTYLVEIQADSSKVIDKRAASPKQRARFDETQKTLRSIEKLLASHEGEWKSTFKIWWRPADKQIGGLHSYIDDAETTAQKTQLRALLDKAIGELQTESQNGIGSVLAGF